MGKGKGKGGCGLLEGIGDCIQCIAGTICCLCVSGPILIIIGIVFIISAFDDTRSERIDEFKVAVDAWNGGAVDNFNMATNSDWTYSLSSTCSAALNGVALMKSEAQEDLKFEVDERGTFGSYPRVTFYEDSPNTVLPSSNCNFNFAISFQNTQVGTVSVPAITRETQRFSDICTQSSSSSSSAQNTQRIQEDVRRCANTCRAQGGEPTGSTINNFVCVKTNVPAEVCIRVMMRNGQWAIAQGSLPDRPGGATGPGCFINDPPGSTWDDVRLQSIASVVQIAVPVRVRHERDPYLYFLDITDGTGDFGLKTSEKLIIGFTLLGIGAIITLLVCGCCCVIVKFARSFASGKQDKPSNPVGAALYDVSAKYGNYIPGGTALGHPVGGGTATGVPAAHVSKPPGDYGTNGQYQYGPGSPYNQGPSGGPSGSPYGAPPYGNTGPPPYGNTGETPYGTSNAGPPPPGYPAAV